MACDLNNYKPLLELLSRDDRLSVWHLALIFGMIQLARGGLGEAIYISRKKIMKIAHVGSISTYHRCLKELIELGYIDYYPSFHPGIKSKIFLTKSVF